MADQERVNGHIRHGQPPEMKPVVVIGLDASGTLAVGFVGVSPEMGLIFIEKAREHIIGGFSFGAPQKIVGVRGNLPPTPPQLMR